MQNKAVDAIAEKLVTAAMPFFVHGTEQRLGLVAKEWTLPSQVERDERVQSLRKQHHDAEKPSSSADFLLIQLQEQRARVSAELVAGARAILCTVSTASRSLLQDSDIAAAVQRITTAVLDEAGTCPETKLPLLLLLPRRCCYCPAAVATARRSRLPSSLLAGLRCYQPMEAIPADRRTALAPASSSCS